MTELELKYGCNPNQKPARIFMEEGELPLKVLNGKPGYINFICLLYTSPAGAQVRVVVHSEEDIQGHVLVRHRAKKASHVSASLS